MLATGWSGLVLFVLGVPLNPLSAALGALVIAISTEFSVLLCARYWSEAGAGSVEAALRRTYRSTGAAVLASGTTAVAGFAVLAFSDVRMLRDFGIVTVVGLTVSLLGVLAVLPSVVVLAARRRVARPRRRGARGPRARARARAGGRAAVSGAEPRAGRVEPALAAEFPGLGRARGDGPRPAGAQPGRRPRAPPAALRRLPWRRRGGASRPAGAVGLPRASSATSASIPTSSARRSRRWRSSGCSRAAGRRATLVADAVRIATVETGVAMLALDAGAVAGVPGVRTAVAGETLGGAGLPAGRLVVADDRAAVAGLFGPVAGRCAVTRETKEVTLLAVVVPGVPALHAEEALWLAGEVLAAAPP